MKLVTKTGAVCSFSVTTDLQHIVDSELRSENHLDATITPESYRQQFCIPACLTFTMLMEEPSKGN